MLKFAVVPHAGTWIEIFCHSEKLNIKTVVPHAGTWIEIDEGFVRAAIAESRSPRGNVD